jgi:prevent-host-death family protein
MKVDFLRQALRSPHPWKIRPISYLKAHAAEVVRTLAAQGEPMIITQNGEAKAVIQDVRSFEETRETLALLKILALGNRQIFKPYRIICRVLGKTAYIYAIADGRRDMQSLLARRLLAD